MLRLQLVATGEFLVMDPSTSVTAELNSTLFNDAGDFLGSKTYDGKIPLEPNKAKLQNKHYINSLATNRNIDVVAWLGDMPFKQVKFTYYIDNGVINYTLLIDNGAIAEQLKNLKMNQVANLDSDQIVPGSPAALAAYMKQTTTAAQGASPMVFFPYKNDGAYKTIDPANYSHYPDIQFPVNNYINAWDCINQVFLVDAAGGKQMQTQTPFFYLVYILRRVIKFFGFKPAGRWMDDPVANKIVIHSQVTINGNIIGDSYTYMPNMGVNDWLKAVRTEFGLLIVFDQTTKICTVESLEFLKITTKILDLQAAMLASYRELPVNTTGYTVSRVPDDKDEAYNDNEKINLPSLIIGDGTSPVDLTSVTTKMLNEAGPTNGGATWKIPYIKQPVYPRTPLDQISSVGVADRNNFKLRWLYYHGMVKDAAGYYYPFGSSDNTDQAGHQLQAFTLELSTSGAAFQVLWSKYSYLLIAKPYEQGFRLTKKQFKDITPDTLIVTRDFNDAPVYNLVDQLTGDITDQPMIMAKAVLYPLVVATPSGSATAAVPVPPQPPIPPFDNGLVYAKLVIRNYSQTNVAYPPPGHSEGKEDIYVMFFADAAASTPKAVTNLAVRYQVDLFEVNNSAGGQTSDTLSSNTVNCNGTDSVLQANAPHHTNQDNYYEWTYTLLPSANYTII